MVRRQMRKLALRCATGSVGDAGAPQTSATVSRLCPSRRGNSAPTMGYLHTSALRRATTSRIRAANPSRNPMAPGSKSGRQAAAATAVMRSASGKAARKVAAAPPLRISSMQRSKLFPCSGASSTIKASTQRQSAWTPPTWAVARAKARSCARIAPHVAGRGCPPRGAAEAVASNAAAPAVRGRARPGAVASRASSCAGASKGSKFEAPLRTRSPASAAGNASSIHESSASGGPSNAQAKYNLWASPAPRSAVATARRRPSSAKASPRRASRASSQPSARSAAPAMA
mmetsp:Transcript_77490/g.224853  ORF Transcript_77490/g.224853 Transcript_77490/m.224853 type:complete len:287 (-) Transcript_77490:1609-2469(-)